MGRPRKTLTDKQWEEVEYLASIHCTGEEIAGALQMDYDTLNKNCKEDKGCYISEYIKEHAKGGNTSLRRAQWKTAQRGNATMLVWLGKQYLGQRDEQNLNINADLENDGMLEALQKGLIDEGNEV